MNRLSLRARGILGASLAVSVWGLASVLVKDVDGLDGVGIAAHRLWMGSLILSAIVLARGGRIDARLLRLCLPGGIAFGLDIMFFFTAVRETTVANATVIGALQPVILLPVASRMFGEQTGRAVNGFALAAVAGTGVVVLGSTGVPEWSPLGDLLAVGALVTWTAYFIVSKRARVHVGALEYFCGLSIVATVLVVPTAVVIGADLAPAGADEWLLVLGIAVMSGSLGHTLLNWAHAHVPLLIVSLLTLLVPVVATAGAWVLLDEALTGVQVLGIGVVLASLVMVIRRSETAPREEDRGAARTAA